MRRRSLPVLVASVALLLSGLVPASASELTPESSSDLAGPSLLEPCELLEPTTPEETPTPDDDVSPTSEASPSPELSESAPESGSPSPVAPSSSPESSGSASATPAPTSSQTSTPTPTESTSVTEESAVEESEVDLTARVGDLPSESPTPAAATSESETAEPLPTATEPSASSSPSASASPSPSSVEPSDPESTPADESASPSPSSSSSEDEAEPGEADQQDASTTPTSSIVCPSAPSGVSATAGASSVTVAWTDVSSSVTAELERLASEGVTDLPSVDAVVRDVLVVVTMIDDPTQTQQASIPATQSEVTVSGLRNGVDYVVAVAAYGSFGSGPMSESVVVTPTTGVEGEIGGVLLKRDEGARQEGASSAAREVTTVGVVDDGEALEGVDKVALTEAVGVDEAQEIAQTIASEPEVEWAEPDLVVLPASDPVTESTDASSWNIDGTFGVGAVDDPSAGAGVTVAVIDTGVTYHPDLDGRLLSGYDFVSNPEVLAAPRTDGAADSAFDGDYAGDFGGLGRDADPTDPGDWRGVAPIRDSSWHGTHTAGVIADVIPGAKIQPIRALSWRGGLLSDVAAGVTWASGGDVDGVPANATPSKVINLSFSVQAACPNTLQTAIDDAVARGSIVVAAAGNAADDATNYAPGNCANVLTVGATNADGSRANYSNYGSVVDVSAPGGAVNSDGGVVAASNTGTTIPGSATTAAREGTSIAAAHTSAALALIAANNPDGTPDAWAEILTGQYLRSFAGDTCDVAAERTCGAGIVQIAATGVAGITMNVTVDDTLVADGSTIGNGDSVTLGAAGLLSPGVGDRELRTSLDSLTPYTSGSAVAPEGWTIEYSTDSGSNWSSSEPGTASDVTDIRASASSVAAGLIEGTNQVYSSETTSQIPSSSFSASTGGDGWDIFFSEDKVFNIFHHDTSALVLDCHWIATGDRCPGYTVSFSGYFGEGHSTAWVDRTSGNIYAITTQKSSARVGALCIDVSSSPTSCGFTELGNVTAYTTSYGSTTAPAVIGRKLFAFDGYTRQLVCFDAATEAACANSPKTLTETSSYTTGYYNRIVAVGDTVMLKTPTKLFCFDENLDACSGFPVTIASNVYYSPLAQHATSDGTPDGVCFYATAGINGQTAAASSCVDTSGTIRTDWQSSFNASTLGNTSYWYDGAQTLGRYYYTQQNGTTISCYDYATNAACSDFTTFTFAGGLNYAIRVDPSNPRCLWMNTHAGLIRNFNAISGDMGCDDVPTITLQPNQFAPRYACSTTSGITEWTELRLVSTTGGGSASSITLTVRTATGDVVPGWSGVPVTVGGALDMTGLDPAVSGSRPTFSFDFSGVTGTISTALIALDYKGKGPELCIDTVATSSSPPEDASVTGTLTENLGIEESFTQTRTFTIGSSASIVEQTVPSAPQNLSGSGLNTTATLTFQAPSDDGGLSINSYVVSSDGGSTWSTASEVDNGDGTYSITVTGLTAGSTYAMRVAAVNDMGRGASASVSVEAQLLSIDSLVDTPVNQGPLTLASTTDGGLPLTYTSSTEAVCTVSGTTVTLVAEGSCELVANQAGDATADPVILPAETEGSFTVLAAYNEPTVPGVPTGVTLTPGNGQVTVAWTAPTSDGYSAITDYIVQYKSGGTWIPFSDGTSTATSMIVAGLTNGTEYSFRVAAVNAIGSGSYTSSLTETPATTPGAPTSLSASITGTTAMVTWVAPTSDGGSAITDYVIEYKLVTDGAWTTFSDGTSTSASASVTGLTSGAEYDFQVTSVNAAGQGESTSTVNLTVTPGDGQAALDWTTPSSPGGTITGYEMQYRTTSGDWTTFGDAYPNTDGTITGLTNGTVYYTRVATIIDGSTVSSYTSVVAVTPRTTPSAPDPDLSPGNRQVLLSWTAPDSGGAAITDYTIQYKATSGSTWSTLVDGISSTTQAAVTGLTNGTSFDFRVKSTNVVGDSSYSTLESATPRTTPDAPTSVAVASVGDGQLDLTWTAPTSTGGSSLTNYQIQYVASGGYSWTTVTRTASTTASQSITGLTNGTTYLVRVASVNAAGTGTYATAVSGTPVTVPGAPTGLTATTSGTTAQLSWTAPASNGGSTITDYEVDYKATTASSWTTWTHSASSTASATLTGLTGLSSGTRYDVRVRTVTNVGNSSYVTTSFPAVTSDDTPTSGSTPRPPTSGGSGGTDTRPPRTSLPVGVVLGSGLVLIDGELVRVVPERAPSGGKWTVSTDEFSLEFTPQAGGSGSFEGPADSLRAPVGGQVQVDGDGYLGDSSVAVYLIPLNELNITSRSTSRSVYLGDVVVGSDGSFTVTLTVPASVDVGDYVLQVNGWSQSSNLRSVNMNMDVYEPMVAQRMGKAAFFKGRSADFSRRGLAKLEAMAAVLPAERENLEVEILAVSTSMNTMEQDLKLAAKRGRAIRSHLRDLGVDGSFTLTVATQRDIRESRKSSVIESSRGKPLTTVWVSFDGPQ